MLSYRKLTDWPISADDTAALPTYVVDEANSSGVNPNIQKVVNQDHADGKP